MMFHELAELVVAGPDAGAVIRVRRGVADERGDLAEGRARFINQILQIVLRRDVRGDRNRGAVTELRIDFGGGRIARILLAARNHHRSEEHTSELQSLMRISYAVFCLKKKNITKQMPWTILNPLKTTPLFPPIAHHNAITTRTQQHTCAHQSPKI